MYDKDGSSNFILKPLLELLLYLKWSLINLFFINHDREIDYDIFSYLGVLGVFWSLTIFF